MKCPQCVASDQRSTVTEHGGTTTCMYYPTFFDEDGKRHHHDGNTRTMHYSCSAGHRWEEKTTGSCWCGWPNDRSNER